MSVKNIFTSIYKTNKWNSKESVSGTGSEIRVTENLRSELPNLISEYNIKSILDLPCGDFNWMSKIDLNGVDYIGADIVTDLIDKNRKYYPDFNFEVMNIIEDKLPKVDLIIVRDCFVHLTYENINKSLLNIKSSGSKYLLTTSFIEKQNSDVANNGGWRPINLLKKPFNLNKYLNVINDGPKKYYGEKYKDKSMVLYDILEI